MPNNCQVRCTLAFKQPKFDIKSTESVISQASLQKKTNLAISHVHLLQLLHKMHSVHLKTSLNQVQKALVLKHHIKRKLSSLKGQVFKKLHKIAHQMYSVHLKRLQNQYSSEKKTVQRASVLHKITHQMYSVHLKRLLSGTKSLSPKKTVQSKRASVQKTSHNYTPSVQKRFHKRP